MKLLRSLRKIKETAAAGSTSAHSIAGFRGGLFSKPAVLRRQRKSVAKIPVIKFKHAASFEEFEQDRSSVIPLYEFNRTDKSKTFDPSDVISKITAKEKLAKSTENSVVFGLEDDKGEITRVYVQKDQASEFEKALAYYLDEAKNNSEIAEILFELKDRFNILNVIWPRVQEDEEVEAPPADEQAAGGEEDLGLEGGAEGEPGDEEMMDDDLGLEGGDEQFDAAGTIDKIIDMLQADIKAKEADARAREEEAKAKEAEATARAAEARIKGEEAVLDMEAHFKKGREEDKETKKLAKLAQYRHELKRETEQEKMAPGLEPDIDMDVNLTSNEGGGAENEEMVKSLKNFLKYNAKRKKSTRG